MPEFTPQAADRIGGGHLPPTRLITQRSGKVAGKLRRQAGRDAPVSRSICGGGCDGKLREKINPLEDIKLASTVREKAATGIGMVGSITFALFSQNKDNLTLADAYGLHCCGELQVNHDPRAPMERSVTEGRKILSERYES